MHRILVPAPALLLVLAPAFAAPSFDCGKTQHEIETLICETPALAALDQEMAKVFAAVEKQPLSDEQLATLKAEQRGWIKGRNDCWKADDKVQCTRDEYTRRRVVLQARYGTAEVGTSVTYSCSGNGKTDEVIFTPVKTDPPSANLVRGEETQTVISAPSGSGAKYEGEFGVSFWTKGNDATLEWPQGTSFTCTTR